MEFEKPLMQVKNLRKQFGNGCIHCIGKEEELQGNYCPHCGTVYALRDISFDVYDGEILGVVGESGSGKSTLIKFIINSFSVHYYSTKARYIHTLLSLFS